MDLSDIAALAAQINMVETPLFESSSRMFQNPEELSKHCMDLIRERPVSRENPMATVQFLSGCDIRGDKLRSLAAASIKVASAAHPVRYEPYAVVAAAAAANSAAAATAAATTPFSGFGKSVWASTDLGDFTKFVLSRHEEILTCALRGSSSAVEALSLNEYTKFVADEWARVSDVSGNDRLFPAGKGMKPELREVVKLYYDAASRVASPLPSPGGVAGVCEDFLMHVPNEMPAVHPHAKAATTLWRTLRAVLPPRGSDRSRWGLSVLAGNGMAFLQRKFAGIIESTVNANLRRACVSSSAGFEAKVDGFLKVIGKGYNEWGKVYYLVLSGKYDVALSLFTDKASPVERALSNFCTNTPIA